MTQREYVSYLKEKGYEILNESQVALGGLVFDIRETVNKTAMGEQKGFCLKLSSKSEISLCPSPWY